MDDLISRREAIDALGKAMPKMTTPDGCGQFDHEIQIADEAFIDAAQIIHDLPSAQPDLDTSLYSDGFSDGYKRAQMDAQEIIRCKDCEDYQTDWETSTGLHYCSIIDTDMPPEGFCSNATRKGEQP